jgi:hypothetical protein
MSDGLELDLLISEILIIVISKAMIVIVAVLLASKQTSNVSSINSCSSQRSHRTDTNINTTSSVILKSMSQGFKSSCIILPILY